MNDLESLSVPGVRWITEERIIQHRCPVCRDLGKKFLVLELKNPFPWSEQLNLYRCEVCRSHFFQPFQFPTYKSANNFSKYSAKYYVEQEAGFESLVTPLTSIDIPRGSSFLEVGCGFGFAVSFARNMLGCNAVGVEPSAIGKMGAAILGESIYCEYLEKVSELAGKKFGVIYSAQTIEHVPDPLAFLDLLVSFLDPHGTLILTTPNAESVSKQTSAKPLLETLSPGFHFSIFSPQAMDSVLKRLGFEHVTIRKSQNQMIVWASRQPFSIHESPDPVSKRLREFLDMLKSSPNPWVVSGALQRLFRTLINLEQFVEADRTYDSLQTMLHKQYGFNLLDIEKTLELLKKANSLAEIGERLPYHLPSMYYYTGKLFLHHRRDYGNAEKLFEAAFQQVPLYLRYQLVGEFILLWWDMKFQVGLIHQIQGRTKEAYKVFNLIANQAQESMAHLGLPGPTPDMIAQASYYAGETALQSGDLAGARRDFGKLFEMGSNSSSEKWWSRALELLADMTLIELKQVIGREWTNPKVQEILRTQLLARLSFTPSPETD